MHGQAELAREAGATVIINNQSQFNGAADKLRILADRKDGERHPLDVGADSVARYFRIEDECAKAQRPKPSRSDSKARAAFQRVMMSGG